MIDTIKLGIPLTPGQHNKLQKLLKNDPNWQWVKFQPSSGELKLVRSRGLVPLDQNSFHREIRFDVSSSYIPEETFLTLEFSVPKFWYGHNIHLLYDFVAALQYLKKLLEEQLHCRFVDVMTWKVSRVDCCYAWRCPSDKIAEQILDSLKRLHFPRKKPIIYPETLLFAGATYSVKFYLKYPEFIKHDRKALLQDKASLEWINYLEELSKGVLRMEATLRRQYLKIQKINTVEDLTKTQLNFEWSQEFIEAAEFSCEKDSLPVTSLMFTLAADALKTRYGCTMFDLFDQNSKNPYCMFDDSAVFYAPPKILIFPNGVELSCEGGKFTVWKIKNPTSILQYFLKKFLGDNRGMQKADEVKLKLYEKYKRDKAHRLYATWKVVRDEGSQRVREDIGTRSFDRVKAELKAAGCSFIEPAHITTLDDEFLKSFSLDVPSIHVTNKVDDFRDTSNVINILPHLVEQSLKRNQGKQS